jgi:hypothetical protein
MHLHPKDRPLPRPEADEDWARLLAWMPGELEELAFTSGALVRRRVVTSGAMVLRLVLLYTVGGVSLRETAAWAARALHLTLTADALAYRFVKALPLLQQLVGRLLQQRLGELPATGLRFRILDATTLTEPGSTGGTWRLHLTFCPSPNAIVGVEVTDHHGAEHLSRAACGAGDLVLGDRGYGHASDIRAAVTRGAACLVRVDLRNVVLTDHRGRQLSPTWLLKACRAGRYDHAVWLHQRGHTPLAVRLVMVPMPKEKAARARQRLCATRKRKTGGRPRALSLRLAGYFCCLTTLPREQAPMAVLVSWYSVRWQIELLFKRCKSLLHLDQLTRGRDALVAVQIWARILVALLIERLSAPALASSVTAGHALSLWRLTRIVWLDIVLAVYGGASLADRLEAADVVLERLRERPRRRRSGVLPQVGQIARALGATPLQPLAAAA